MQPLDMLLLLVVIGLTLAHCYKKRKFPFSFLAKNKNTEIKDIQEGAQACATPPPFPTVANVPPVLPQGAYGMPYSMENLQGVAPMTAPTPPTNGVDLVKLIPWVVDGYDPLPFGTTQLDLDNAIQNELPTIGLTLNSEIIAMQQDGYSVISVNAVTLPVDDGIRILFVLSCTHTLKA